MLCLDRRNVCKRFSDNGNKRHAVVEKQAIGFMDRWFDCRLLLVIRTSDPQIVIQKCELGFKWFFVSKRADDFWREFCVPFPWQSPEIKPTVISVLVLEALDFLSINWIVY